MYFHTQRLINEIPVAAPNPAAANALQEGLGGQFGEMRTMMQYLFQSINFRGDATPYRDLIHAVAVEEISHVELIGTTLARLLDDAPRFEGRKDAPAYGGSPAKDGEELITTDAPPPGFPITTGAERPEEYSPGLTPELEELADAIKRINKPQ
mgnify:CR=1 FL=1